MASVTFTKSKVFVVGDRKEVIGTVTLTGSYTTGGESVPGSLLGLDLEVTDVQCGNAVVTGGVFDAEYNNTTGKLQLFGAVDATPAANEASPELAAAAIPGGPANVRIRAIGKGKAA